MGLAGSEVGELAGREQMLHRHDQALVAQAQLRYWETLARLGVVGVQDLVAVTDYWILQLAMGNCEIWKFWNLGNWGRIYALGYFWKS